MNIKRIRSATIILAIGYLCFAISIFSYLSRIEGLGAANYLTLAMFPGLIFLTIGTSMIKKEYKLFNASAAIIICLDIIYVIYMLVVCLYVYDIFQKPIVDVIPVAIQVFEALITVLLAIAGSLLANGFKEIFKQAKNKLMMSYSWVMGFAATKLVILSAALPVITVNKFSAIAIFSLVILVDFVLHMSFAVFMIFSNYYLREFK